MSFAFVFPGQGSQSIGMLAALSQIDPVVRATFDEASAALGYDLWQLIQEGPKERLDSTECTQPAMLAAGVATWRLWHERGGVDPIMVSGHSLGEFTAFVCAGAIEFATAVDLVRFRGQVMQEAVPAGQGAMAAILGLDDDDVRQVCSEASAGESSKPSISIRPDRLSLQVKRPPCSGPLKPPRPRVPRRPCRCRSACHRTAASCGAPVSAWASVWHKLRSAHPQSDV